MYYILLPKLVPRTELIDRVHSGGIHIVFHYVPLHNSVAGQRFGRAHGSCLQTNALSEQLVRLPLWIGLTDDMVSTVVTAVVAEARRYVASENRSEAFES
jgi:dTDP-4-amino-4,6-dideoxygalactose transaminase